MLHQLLPSLGKATPHTLPSLITFLLIPSLARTLARLHYCFTLHANISPLKIFYILYSLLVSYPSSL